MVVVIDFDIQAAEADNFMELAAALVDGAEFWHESAYFISLAIHLLGQEFAERGDFIGREIGGYRLGDEEDFLFYCHFLRYLFGRESVLEES